MKDKKIVEAFIKGKSVIKYIGLRYEDGTTGELCSFRPDLSPQFYLEEFTGLTRKEALNICKDKYSLL